jgi:hypothetical protein
MRPAVASTASVPLCVLLLLLLLILILPFLRIWDASLAIDVFLNEGPLSTLVGV